MNEQRCLALLTAGICWIITSILTRLVCQGHFRKSPISDRKHKAGACVVKHDTSLWWGVGTTSVACVPFEAPPAVLRPSSEPPFHPVPALFPTTYPLIQPRTAPPSPPPPCSTALLAALSSDLSCGRVSCASTPARLGRLHGRHDMTLTSIETRPPMDVDF